MFTIFKNKNRYDRGQVFPFLIAMLVAVLAIAMITVNLGQIGIFKTDVSNAADAGALAGASTLSGYLLGIGIQSDKMCGLMLVELTAIILLACSVIGIPVAVAVYAAITAKQLTTWFQSQKEGEMAWSNAKKTAMQYAFQNAGVDEPRPTFKQFLRKVYGIDDPDSLSAQQIANYNRIYALGDDPALAAQCPDDNTGSLECRAKRRSIKDSTQTGFSRFMEGSWFWDEGAWGDIEPGNISPGIVTNGYGWNANGQNSFDDGSIFTNYENYVQVSVIANSAYPLKLYNPGSELVDSVTDWVTARIDPPWWLEWLGDAIGWVIKIAVSPVLAFMPAGLKMDDIGKNTDGNPVTVIVSRYKRNEDLGLWNFRYGIVESQSSSHVYREAGDEDIKPLFLTNIVDFVTNLFSGEDWDFQWFNTSKHLFETELTTVR